MKNRLRINSPIDVPVSLLGQHPLRLYRVLGRKGARFTRNRAPIYTNVQLGFEAPLIDLWKIRNVHIATNNSIFVVTVQ